MERVDQLAVLERGSGAVELGKSGGLTPSGAILGRQRINGADWTFCKMVGDFSAC